VAVRTEMIRRGLSRKYINDQVCRLRGMFRWAVAEELVSVDVYQRLLAVEGLRRGVTDARETRPIEPVSDDVVEATLPFLGSVVRDMVQFQRLTGCRPGEVIRIRPCDVDRSDEVWTIQLSEHKTAHHGKPRIIYVGPRAQGILANTS
jgi:integrase